jgi:hypothetical protein
MVARSQQPERMLRIGVLIGADENDSVWKTRVSAFTQALVDLVGPRAATCGQTFGGTAITPI